MAAQSFRPSLGIDDYVEGVRSGDRTVLARAITLIESRRPEHRELADRVLQELLPDTGRANRVGITGAPGVGKSTFIETLGTRLTSRGHQLAVLAVDPSSKVSGGSILGDKTRMSKLAADPDAFIRPSPTAGTLGGVARRTRESMLVCEAAGFDVVLVETVGAGQSETQVSEMVDFFMVLQLPGAGDDLQGIKKGVVELADLIAVNKSDGDNRDRALQAAAEYRSALQILRDPDELWSPPVLNCSGLTGEGLDDLWQTVEEHRRLFEDTGELARLRERQRLDWMWSLLDERLLEALRRHPAVGAALPGIEQQVVRGEVTPGQGVTRLLELFGLEP